MIVRGLIASVLMIYFLSIFGKKLNRSGVYSIVEGLIIIGLSTLTTSNLDMGNVFIFENARI